jgi:hypothetical protein
MIQLSDVLVLLSQPGQTLARLMKLRKFNYSRQWMVHLNLLEQLKKNSSICNVQFLLGVQKLLQLDCVYIGRNVVSLVRDVVLRALFHFASQFQFSL